MIGSTIRYYGPRRRFWYGRDMRFNYNGNRAANINIEYLVRSEYSRAPISVI